MKEIPYFSQWASRELTNAYLADGAAALRRDPRWAESGAATVDEYARWASHLCGMACLKMIVASRSGRTMPTLELARACTAYGGYRIDEVTGEIKGLIYAPFVKYVAREFGLTARVVTGVTAEDLPALLSEAEFFIASVHPSIRWPEREPPVRGGHLVLVLKASENEVVFHNPSGHEPRTQERAQLAPGIFDRFFAGRGIAVR